MPRTPVEHLLVEDRRVDLLIGFARELDEVAGGIAHEHLHHAARQPRTVSPRVGLDHAQPPSRGRKTPLKSSTRRQKWARSGVTSPQLVDVDLLAAR